MLKLGKLKGQYNARLKLFDKSRPDLPWNVNYKMRWPMARWLATSANDRETLNPANILIWDKSTLMVISLSYCPWFQL